MGESIWDFCGPRTRHCLQCWFNKKCGEADEIRYKEAKKRIIEKIVEKAEPGTTVNGNRTRTTMFIGVVDALEILDEELR